MQTLARICEHDPQWLLATPFETIDLTVAESVQAGIGWWEALTERGGEGMVVKPLDFVVRSQRGLVQPAVKCRGREYLRIIYGPDYDSDENLPRLRARHLGGKRSLALRRIRSGNRSPRAFRPPGAAPPRA